MNDYFPSLKENQYSEKDFMWSIVLNLRPEEKKILIEDARRHGIIKRETDKENLMNRSRDCQQNYTNCFTKRLKLEYSKSKFYQFIQGVLYLFKKIVKLQRRRTFTKEYITNYLLLNTERKITPNSSEGIQWERRSTYSTPTHKMTDRDKEENISSLIQWARNT